MNPLLALVFGYAAGRGLGGVPSEALLVFCHIMIVFCVVVLVFMIIAGPSCVPSPINHELLDALLRIKPPCDKDKK